MSILQPQPQSLEDLRWTNLNDSIALLEKHFYKLTLKGIQNHQSQWTFFLMEALNDFNIRRTKLIRIVEKLPYLQDNWIEFNEHITDIETQIEDIVKTLDFNSSNQQLLTHHFQFINKLVKFKLSNCRAYMLRKNIKCSHILDDDVDFELDLNDPSNYEFRMYLKNSKVGKHFKNILVKTFYSEEITSIEDIFDKNKKKIEREVKKKVERRIVKAHERESNGHERVGFKKNTVIPASHFVIPAKAGIQTQKSSFNNINDDKVGCHSSETRESLSMQRHTPHGGNSEVNWTSSIPETRSRREGNPENNNSNSNNIDNSRSHVFAQGSTEMKNLSSVITAKAVIQKRENSVDNTFNIENTKNGSPWLSPEYDNACIADINIFNKITDPPPKEMRL